MSDGFNSDKEIFTKSTNIQGIVQYGTHKEEGGRGESEKKERRTINAVCPRPTLYLYFGGYFQERESEGKGQG